MGAMASFRPRNDPFKLMAAPTKDLPDLPPLLDQAVLDPLLTDEQLLEGCDAGRQEKVRGICTTLQHVPALRDRLGGKDGPRLIATIGFPFGALPQELKLSEAEWAAAHGADELDVVPNFKALINGRSGAFAEELASICGLGLPARVILDMARMPTELLAVAVEAAIDAGASGVQTGNGFGPPASPEQIEALKPLCRGRCAIKAAGGIHSLEQVLTLIEAGANLLGTSSAPQLLQSLRRPGHRHRQGDLTPSAS